MNLKKLLSFEQGRIKFFETLTKHPENWQQNPTPLPIIRKMVNKTSLDDKKILVLFNIEFLQVLVDERKINPENIYYIADNELEYLASIKVFKVQSSKIQEYSVAGVTKLIAGTNMNFDIVFSNPPYNRGVDIKILNSILNNISEFIVIHPSTWLLDMKNKTKLYTDFKKAIEGKVLSLEMFNGNNIFNIELFVPILITHYSKNYCGDCDVVYFDDAYKSSSIFNVTKFSDKWLDLIKPFFTTVQEFCANNSNVWQHNKLSIDSSKFHCQLAAIRGTPVRSKNSNEMLLDDFYTMVMKNPDANKGIRQPNLTRAGNATPTFEFDTELELNNFINYLQTDFARFCFALYKNNNNTSVGEMELIPWLDFTEEWDDDKLFKKFEVSQELQDYIREFLPDFHETRN